MKRTMKITKKKEVYRDEWLKVNRLETEIDGKPGSYTTVEKDDCVVVVIKYLDCILLIESYRFPIQAIEWEVLAGAIEPSETAENAAHRELKEEAGIDVPLIACGSFYIIPGLSNQKAHIFLGEIQSEEKKTILEYDNRVDEIVDRQFFTFQEINSMIREREICDMITLASLYHLHSFMGVNL